MHDALRLSDKVFPPYVDGALIASCSGEHEVARRFITTALELGGPQPHLIAYQGYVHARAGERAEAEKALDRLAASEKSGRVLNHDVAIVNIALERFDVALAALDRAHRDREYLVVLMGISPVFDPLHDEPRFKALLDDMHFPISNGDSASKN
jgi:Flp pilus assembly protein TadD